MHKRTLILCASLLVVSLVAACGGGGSNDEIPPAPAGGGGSGGGPAFDMSKVNATVTGKISFEGTPPPNDKAQMSSDPYCQMHAADYPTVETTKVSDGGLENVIVYISGNAPTGSFPLPEPMEINQENCHYIPHVFTLRTGQQLKVKNSDATLHNIHALPKGNKEFNTGQPIQGMKTTHTFEGKEVMVPFKCDVHGWMNAYVGVLDHPYFATTGDDGKFELKTLPPGTYTIEAWHEKLGATTQSVTLGPKESKEIMFTFKAPA